MVAVLVIILVIICVINITVTVTAISTSNVGLKIKALSVFRPDETDMHKYSAILAATEPFRLQCTKQIKESINPLKYLLITISGNSIIDAAEKMREENKDIDLALARYEMRVDSTLRSYGMTTQSFNKLSKVIIESKDLKQRVLLQAYYYKIAADLENNLQPTLPLLPSVGINTSRLRINPLHHDDQPTVVTTPSAPTLHNPAGVASKKGAVKTGPTPGTLNTTTTTATATKATLSPVKVVQKSIELNPMEKFSRVVKTIEMERMRMRQHIMDELKIRELPARMSDPDLQPALSPVIVKANNDFPKIVTQIITAYGMSIEDFNNFHEKLDKNVIFRYKVQSEIKKIEKKAMMNKKAREASKLAEEKMAATAR